MRSAFSADGPSTMSQPVRNARAPRLAPTRRKWRRVGSRRSLAASLARSPASTPGTDVLERDIPSLLSGRGSSPPRGFLARSVPSAVDGEEDHDYGHPDTRMILR